jgi:AraC-like DNA-binding protein
MLGVPSGDSVDKLESVLTSSINYDELVNAANAFFAQRIRPFDRNAELAKQLVRQVLEDRELCAVEALADRGGISRRTLQRLFNDYVGASPKWVIRRYRLHDAVKRLRTGEALDFAQIALELGYFDQAHLINDFKGIIGYSPTQFQNVLRSIRKTR